MLDHIKPVRMFTEATLGMAMLSSSEPIRCGFIRVTRSRVISIRTGKNKLPEVHRLAVNTCFWFTIVPSAWLVGLTPELPFYGFLAAGIF
jgi:hypothetical protein